MVPNSINHQLTIFTQSLILMRQFKYFVSKDSVPHHLQVQSCKCCGIVIYDGPTTALWASWPTASTWKITLLLEICVNSSTVIAEHQFCHFMMQSKLFCHNLFGAKCLVCQIFILGRNFCFERSCSGWRLEVLIPAESWVNTNFASSWSAIAISALIIRLQVRYYYYYRLHISKQKSLSQRIVFAAFAGWQNSTLQDLDPVPAGAGASASIFDFASASLSFSKNPTTLLLTLKLWSVSLFYSVFTRLLNSPFLFRWPRSDTILIVC